METTDRKNLNENLRENKRRVDSQTRYEGLHRWPHRDKIGRSLQQHILYITTNSWPQKRYRKRSIQLTPQDNPALSTNDTTSHLEPDTNNTKKTKTTNTTPPYNSKKRIDTKKTSPADNTANNTDLGDRTSDSRDTSCPLANLLQLYNNPAVNKRQSKRLTPSSKKQKTAMIPAPQRIKRMLKELEENRVETPPRRKYQRKGKNTTLSSPQIYTPRMLKELTEDRLDKIHTLTGNKRKRASVYETRKEIKITTTTERKGVG